MNTNAQANNSVHIPSKVIKNIMGLVYNTDKENRGIEYGGNIRFDIHKQYESDFNYSGDYTSIQPKLKK